MTQINADYFRQRLKDKRLNGTRKNTDKALKKIYIG